MGRIIGLVFPTQEKEEKKKASKKDKQEGDK